MTERRIRHVPVVVEGRLVGIVSIGDVVKAELDQYLGEVDTLQMQVGGAGLDVRCRSASWRGAQPPARGLTS